MALPVEKLNRDLEGEFRFRGRPVSVPFALPGDLVQFRTERTGRRGMRVRPTHIERSEVPDRTVRSAAPFCMHFGICGGCRGQHLEYSFQLELTAEPLRGEMERRYGFRPELIGAPALTGFRNRMDFVVESNALGLRPAGDYTAFVPMSECPVQTPEANQVLARMAQLLERFPRAGFCRGLGRRRAAEEITTGSAENHNEQDNASHRDSQTDQSDQSDQSDVRDLGDASANSGPLKYATIRSGSSGGMLVLTIAAGWSPQLSFDYDQLKAALMEDLPASWSIVECEVESRSEVSCVSGGRVLRGHATFEARLGGHLLQVPYDGFFQPNPQAFDLLLAWVNGRLAPIREGREELQIADLYCGVGALGLAVGAAGKNRVLLTGYESVGSAIDSAPLNVAPLDPRAHFVVADLNQPPADLFSPQFDLVLIDPPRVGMSAPLRKSMLRTCRAPFVMYVSCNPRSQLADLDVLGARFRPVAACITDCFPHTGHLEQAVLLSRIPE